MCVREKGDLSHTVASVCLNCLGVGYSRAWDRNCLEFTDLYVVLCALHGYSIRTFNIRYVYYTTLHFTRIADWVERGVEFWLGWFEWRDRWLYCLHAPTDSLCPCSHSLAMQPALPIRTCCFERVVEGVIFIVS
jgi:hypothetical protein